MLSGVLFQADSSAPSRVSLINQSSGRRVCEEQTGEGSLGALCAPSSRPLASPLLLPQPLTPPAGAQVGAQGLHLSEALLRLPFPELGAPRGGARRRSLEGREQRTEGRASWSRQHWGQNWEFLSQFQLFCPIV